MEEIVNVHFPNLDIEMLKQVMEAFYWIRGLSSIQKKPSTSEVLDWIQALQLGGISQQKIKSEIPFCWCIAQKK